MKRKAVWHHGPHGEATSAVWKAKDSKGNIVYICNTHRSMAKGKTLESAINNFHRHIKETA